LWQHFLWENAMRLVKETNGLQMVYSLKDENLDEVFGEAVVSATDSEIRLHGIFVKKEHRGKGCGRTLMEAILSLAEAKLITLCTGLGNIAFFEKFGFEVIEVGDSLAFMERRL